MARRLQASQNQGQQAELAAWTAVVFASITALAVWGVANAYSLHGKNSYALEECTNNSEPSSELHQSIVHKFQKPKSTKSAINPLGQSINSYKHWQISNP